VTYALLLARFSGSTELGIDAAARTLSRGHTLLSQALKILTDEQARREIDVGVALLERAISAVDLKALTSRNPDPWLYLPKRVSSSSATRRTCAPTTSTEGGRRAPFLAP
jgi:hypothetical protein